MKHLLFSSIVLVAACGPLTEKEKGGDLEFKVNLQNNADIAIQLKVVFDRCKIEPEKAVATAPARQAFSQTFVGDCETDEDYDNNDEKIELSSESGKHNFVIASGCREAVTCDNDGCLAALDANCKEQPVAKPAAPAFR